MFGTLTRTSIRKLPMRYPQKIRELPESTEITAPKAQLGIAKKFIIRYDYSIQAAANVNMRFARTNDLIATDFVSIDPALGLEFGYTDLVCCSCRSGKFSECTASWIVRKK